MSPRAYTVTPPATTAYQLAPFLTFWDSVSKIISAILVSPIKLSVVILCALSAQTRPLEIILSAKLTCEFRAAFAAALNRLTFSCGVSPVGRLFLGSCELLGGFALKLGGFAEA